MIERAAIELTGLVQGVGYRPFVYGLATSLQLRGFVQNRGSRLVVDVEGEGEAVQRFEERLARERPVQASVERIDSRRLPPASHVRFVIAPSHDAADAVPNVPPDVATCDACVAELFDPRNRRYRHAFIACATCGPRYSILRRLPFDRANTTMAGFPLCGECGREYADPDDRRLHAQTICCRSCGPVLEALANGSVAARGDEAIRLVAEAVAAGGIVAVKGIGGVHLCCDATSDRAVNELRRRKGREAKPFAVMLPAADAYRATARLDGHTRAGLDSAERPILLVDRATVERAGIRLSDAVAARCATVGLFAPYSPVHHLLLHDVGLPLVMTSANASDEPMVHDNTEALARLGGVADFVLLHDRDIVRPCDDGVVRIVPHGRRPIRRGRGAAPAPLFLAEAADRTVLALGADLKNTFCFVEGSRAYVSTHVGNLDEVRSRERMAAEVARLGELLQLRPDVIAHDHHPDSAAAALLSAYPDVPRVPVQHHVAHVLAGAAEHRCTEPVIGVAFDGAGLGTDGAIWGGEFLIVDGVEVARAAHFKYVALPGGDAAAREPWRMAVAHLHHACGSDPGGPGDDIARRVGASRVEFVRRMIARNTASPPTSSVGRLFDAVAALVGLRDVSQFEGQAAMELEAVATDAARAYACDLDTTAAPWVIDPVPLIRAVAADVRAGRAVGAMAAAFHDGIAAITARTVLALSARTGIRRVVLTGGVFQNARLSLAAARALSAAGLHVLEHCHVPCNDGGVSLGQAVYATRASRARGARTEMLPCA